MKLTKKGQEKTIVNILIILISLAILVGLIKTCMEAGDEYANENICRGTVALREKAHLDINMNPLVPGSSRFDIAPLLCVTSDKQIPKSKNDDEDAVMKQFADAMVRCRWMFGDAVVPNIFDDQGGIGGTNECFVCYLVSTDTKSGWEFKEPISGERFMNFLMETPYLVDIDMDNCYVAGGGTCAAEASECKGLFGDSYDYKKDSGACKETGKPVCCYSNLECVRKGGTCAAPKTLDESEYVRYPGWACDSNSECYVEKDNLLTYSDYLQFYRGYSNYMVGGGIEPNKVYAIAYGSPNGECTWCTDVGIAAGVTAAAAVGILLAIPSGGTSLAGSTIAIAAITAGTGYGMVAASGSALMEEALADRNVNTVYMYPYDGSLADVCNFAD